MLALILLSAVILLITLGWLAIKIRIWRVDKNIPVMPGAMPIVGHAYLRIKTNADFWNMIEKYSALVNNTDGIAKILLGPIPLYLIADPEMALTVANTSLDKMYMYDFFGKPWTANGLVGSNESIWRRHRKLLNPTFNQHILDGFLGIFNRQSEYWTDRMSVEVGKGPFDTRPYLTENALETVCKTLFTIDDVNDDVIDKEYKSAVANIFELMSERLVTFPYHFDFIYKFSSSYKERNKSFDIVKNMSYNVIQRKKVSRNTDFAEEDDSKLRKIKTFLDLLLELMEQGSLTEKEIREEVDTIIAATYDTSPTAIMYILVVLGSFPDVQQKVYEEIIAVLGKTEKDVEKDDFVKLVYMEAVVKEVLRLYTVVPVIGRYTTKDVKINEKYTIPSNTNVIFGVHAIHRNKCWGDDVDEFRPDRWLQADKLPKSAAAFSPFGMGRRTCLGKSYAMMTIKITLAYFLRRYVVRGDHTKLKFRYDIMLKPLSGHHVSIEKRT